MRRRDLAKWAWEELNFRPHAYQAPVGKTPGSHPPRSVELRSARLSVNVPETRPKCAPWRRQRVDGAQIAELLIERDLALVVLILVSVVFAAWLILANAPAIDAADEWSLSMLGAVIGGAWIGNRMGCARPPRADDAGAPPRARDSGHRDAPYEGSWCEWE